MKVTYNWLKDFVQLKVNPWDLAEKLTMSGLEVVSLKEAAGDYVFEIEITSNRPDWLSIAGIAREVAAVSGSRLKPVSIPPVLRPARRAAESSFAIHIEDKKDCPFYTARLIRGVKVGQSPHWLKERLELIGCRSVNNIVDVTNYILFVYGEPLHAFDADKLKAGGIIVRRAKDKERLVTIDGEARQLDKEILIIADRDRPLAVAGVMGGADTEVSSDTSNILLEAAIFNPVLVRRSRQRLGLQTEAAYRFERGVAPGIVAPASSAASRMIKELASGEPGLYRSCGTIRPARKSVILHTKDVASLLGLEISKPRIKAILSDLGFRPQSRPQDKLCCWVPDWRQDISSHIDLIEELARVYGYEKIPVSLPAVRPSPKAGQARGMVCLVKNALVGLGLNEVITHSLVSRQLLSDCAISLEGLVEIRNPLSKEQEVLRPGLLASLARCVAYNLNQKQEHLGIFEIAKAFTAGSGILPKEELSLGVALCGARPLLLANGLVKDEASPLHLKGIAESLFRKFGITGYSFAPDPSGRFNVYINHDKLGAITALSADVLARLDIKNQKVFILELCLEKIFAFAGTGRRFNPLPKYPGITRDISCVVKDGVAVKDILAAIQHKGQPYLVHAEVSDYYKGRQIPQGHKSLTFSCLYRSAERTLTEAEINPLHAGLVLELKERFGALMR